MERLSGLDASFLYLETPTQLLHVCGLLELDPETVPDGYSFDKLKHEIFLRTRAIPAFRRKLYDSPLNVDHPVWIDDADFDIDRHLHRTAIPAPGGREQLAEACAHIAGIPMDRQRPLWEFWVIEGLADGKIAVMTKMHHASVDGVSGANLLGALCGIEPDAPRPEPDPSYRPARKPSALRLAIDGITHLALRPLDIVKLLPETVALAGDWIVRHQRGDSMPPPFSAPRTSFNGTITGHRSVAFTAANLDDVKEIKRAFGTTVNDVVLAVCAGALRSYLESRGELPESPLLAMVPVSVREDENAASASSRNKVSGLFSSLPTDIADPVKRLETIATDNAVTKEHHQTISAAMLQDWAEFAAPTTFGLAVRAYSSLRLAERHPVVYNLVISNVPGPPIPMYFLGAEVLGLYPLGPVFHGAGLNVTVLSNNGKLDVGIIACLEQVPNPWAIADEVPRQIELLVAAARKRTGKEAPTAPKAAPTKKAVSTKKAMRKAPAKKATSAATKTASKAGATKAAASKATATKTTAPRTAAAKSTATKAPATKTSASKTAAATTAAKSTATKKAAAPRKTAPRKTAPRKTAAKATGPSTATGSTSSAASGGSQPTGDGGTGSQ